MLFLGEAAEILYKGTFNDVFFGNNHIIKFINEKINVFIKKYFFKRNREFIVISFRIKIFYIIEFKLYINGNYNNYLLS